MSCSSGSTTSTSSTSHHKGPFHARLETISSASKSIIDAALTSQQFTLPIDLSVYQIEAMMKDIVSRSPADFNQLDTFNFVNRLVKLTLRKRVWAKYDVIYYMSIFRSYLLYDERSTLQLEPDLLKNYMRHLLIYPHFISVRNFEYVVRRLYTNVAYGRCRWNVKELEQVIIAFLLRRMDEFCSLTVETDTTYLFWRIFSWDGLHLTSPDRDALRRICDAVAKDLLFKSMDDDRQFMFMSSVTKAAMLFLTFGPHLVDSRRPGENWWNVWVNCWTRVQMNLTNGPQIHTAVVQRFLNMCIAFDRMDSFDEHSDLWFSRLNGSLKIVQEDHLHRFRTELDDLLKTAPAFQAGYSARIQSAFLGASIDHKKPVSTAKHVHYKSVTKDVARKYIKAVCSNNSDNKCLVLSNVPVISAIVDFVVDLSDVDLRKFVENRVAEVVQSWSQILNEPHYTKFVHSSYLVHTLARLEKINKRSGGEVLKRIDITHLNRIIELTLTRTEDDLLCEEVELLMELMMIWKQQDPRVQFELKSLKTLCQLCATGSEVQLGSNDAENFNFCCLLSKKTFRTFEKSNIDLLVSRSLEKLKSGGASQRVISLTKIGKLLLEFERADVPSSGQWLDAWTDMFAWLYDASDNYQPKSSDAFRSAQLLLDLCLKFERTDLLRRRMKNIRAVLSGLNRRVSEQQKALFLDRCLSAISHSAQSDSVA